MIKIVIADDEKLIRAGIRKILNDNLKNELEIIEAKNGREALELCTEAKPDVLITDIKMPVMDGLELMKKISTLPEKIATIVLSGFDDFSYARTAIENGVLAYVLKPVDAKELIPAVNKALSNVKKEEQSKNEQRFRDIMSGQTSRDDTLAKTNFPEGFYCVLVKNAPIRKEPCSCFESNKCYLLEQKKNLLTFVVSKDFIKEFTSSDKLSGATVGISLLSDEVLDLRRLYRQAFTCILRSLFDEGEKKESVMFYKKDSEVIDFTEVENRYDKFMGTLEVFSDRDLTNCLDNLFTFDRTSVQAKCEILFYIYEKIINNLFKRYSHNHDTDTYLYLKSLMIEDICNAASLEEWKQYIVDYSLYLIELLKINKGKYPVITKAIDYVNRHFNENITMAQVANHISMNYTWFSEKFKEQTGMNFNDYIKKYRMEHAKNLLEKGIYKVYEVAAKCGFKDTKHFMKVFRQVNGMSAGEWARIHGASYDD